ncbi:hypothetical protein NXW53_14625 [Bacteroides ovatus]|jgi:hypothetical protein|nr:hypothetical protein [Bacteroides ovatus]
MSELTKIIFTINIVVLFIQLGLSIVYNWDEETEKNKRIEKITVIGGAITMAVIGISSVVFLLKWIWEQ